MITKSVGAMEDIVVSGVTLQKDEAKVTIRDVPDKPGMAAQIFRELAGKEINVDMIVQNVSREGSTDLSFTVVKSDLPATLWFNNVSTALSGNVVSVTMTLNANSAYDLAYWINSLEVSGPYRDVTVGAIAVTDTEMGKKFTLPLSMKYDYK